MKISDNLIEKYRNDKKFHDVCLNIASLIIKTQLTEDINDIFKIVDKAIKEYEEDLKGVY